MADYKSELQLVEDELATVEVDLQELLDRQSLLLDKKAELKAILDQQETNDRQKEDRSWDGTDFPWTKDLDEKLKSIFKLSSLRPMQRQTMNATLAKEDCLLIMPTGGGKSLCFQLPALVDKGLTLVVSPLVSLMEDQQMALEELDVPSAMLNAATHKDDLKNVQDDMASPDVKLRLLYVTPEKLAKSKRFMNRLEKCYAVGNLARIVIDEVHCCSQWGHDFRPDYKFLGIMKRQFPTTPILGLTATATVKVLEDVKKILNIPRAILFKASFNRPNLFYEVRQKPGTQKDTMDEIYFLIARRFRDQSGIIYCFSRKDSEEVTSDLQSRGVKAGCYHADMDSRSRSMVHRKWLAGEIKVVVATVAFGMGIDKPDVRFVIHHTISKSMENLYQESGRAGRDDKRSDCIAFYRLADVARQSSMVFTEQTGLQNLHGIVKYCIDVGSCRRSIIARHFGEVWDSSQCNGMCDHCDHSNKGSTTKQDVSKYCQDVLSILDAASATEQRVTSAKILDSWFGKGPSTLRVKSVAVPKITRETAERILAHMLVYGYVREDFHFTAYSTICYIVPGSKAKLLRNNAAKVMVDVRVKSGKSSTSESADTSGSSQSPSIKKTQSTCSKSKASGEKPKLVVVNKEKSHFSPTSLSSSLSSPSVLKSSPSSSAKPKLNKTDSQNDDSTKKNKDVTKSKILTKKLSSSEKSSKKTSLETKRQSDCDLQGLRFDDSDDEIVEQTSEEMTMSSEDKLSNSNSLNHTFTKKNSQGSAISDTKAGRKKKIVINDDSSDNEEINGHSASKIRKREEAEIKEFKGAKDGHRKRNSIVISDDDDFM